MSRRTTTIPADYFEGLYTADADPWRFRSSAYEASKYRATLDALSRDRYGTALEVGCSIGVFTAMLAPRCDDLLAIDGSAAALEAARSACADIAGLRFEQRMIPNAFPPGRFDLIVLSEVVYYLTPADVAAAASRCFDAQGEGGEIVLCHWLGETDYPLTGEEAASLFVAAAAAEHGYTHTLLGREIYRLDRLSRR